LLIARHTWRIGVSLKVGSHYAAGASLAEQPGQTSRIAFSHISNSARLRW
jgi:hypothetical protein